jgi:hypothetical protein
VYSIVIIVCHCTFIAWGRFSLLTIVVSVKHNHHFISLWPLYLLHIHCMYGRGPTRGLAQADLAHGSAAPAFSLNILVCKQGWCWFQGLEAIIVNSWYIYCAAPQPREIIAKSLCSFSIHCIIIVQHLRKSWRNRCYSFNIYCIIIVPHMWISLQYHCCLLGIRCLIIVQQLRKSLWNHYCALLKHCVLLIIHCKHIAHTLYIHFDIHL